MSMSRGCFIASVTADLVMALNTTRCTTASLTTLRLFKTCSTCQLIASPSRSGSVARISLSAPFMAAAMSESRFAALGSTSQIISKSSSGFTEPSFDGRSRTCP